MRRQLDATLRQSESATAAQAAEIQAAKDAIVKEYRQSQAYKRDAVQLLRPDLQRTLGQVHDYKQFVQQIAQNIDVILETRFPGQSIDAKLARAEHEEAAIYWAAQLMDEKLDVALFLLNPDRIHLLRDERAFRLHGLVTKYWKIYQRQIEAKVLRVIREGESRADVEGSGRAVSVIVHAFIDNAVKYAPAGSRIVFAFEETAENVRFTVESLGPPIGQEEKEAIFDLFVRGKEAVRRHSDGTGFGLASARLVAETLDIEIGVTQSEVHHRENTRLTTAFMVVPRDIRQTRRNPNEAGPRRASGSRRRRRSGGAGNR